MLGLRDDPPDVVVAHDFGAPAHSALRLRQAGLAFEDTLFVVFCHGPRRYVVDLSPNVALGDLRAVVGVGVLEQAAVKLADVVVSPSAYLLEWMRGRGWQLPERSLVIPYFTRSEATGEAVAAAARPEPGPLRRFAFFGRVDEKKGLKTFAAALNALEPERLKGLELEFIGKTTRTWTRQRVEALLSEEAKRALSRIAFATELDQPEALERISSAGTLVVMPSLQENSPNAVYECLELGIPFIASNVGGVPELIAPDDRPRILFEPTAEALEDTLRGVLAEGRVPGPARPAFERGASLKRWAEVIELQPEPQGIAEGVDAEFVLVPEGDDELRETLVRVQRATGADVVSCGVRLGDGGLRFFHGNPGGLGALANTYGTVALVRRELLHEGEDEWTLLARAAASGASIVSIPLPLVESDAEPGAVENDPAAALRAVQQLERALPDPLRGAARIAAGLAARAAERDVTTRSNRRRRPRWRR
jgi:glycosyltransferase involved in cell wall biosynthesis